MAIPLSTMASLYSQVVTKLCLLIVCLETFYNYIQTTITMKTSNERVMHIDLVDQVREFSAINAMMIGSSGTPFSLEMTELCNLDTKLSFMTSKAALE